MEEDLPLYDGTTPPWGQKSFLLHLKYRDFTDGVGFRFFDRNRSLILIPGDRLYLESNRRSIKNLVPNYCYILKALRFSLSFETPKYIYFVRKATGWRSSISVYRYHGSLDQLVILR